MSARNRNVPQDLEEFGVDPKLTLEDAQRFADHIDAEVLASIGLPTWINKIDDGGYRVADLKSPQFLQSQEAYRKLMEKE